MSSDKKESPTKSNTDKDDPPTKAERQRCYGNRDLHWKCLDENGEDEENCKETRKVYAASCPEKWIQHFDHKYRYDRWKLRNEEEEKRYNASIKK